MNGDDSFWNEKDRTSSKILSKWQTSNFFLKKSLPVSGLYGIDFWNFRKRKRKSLKNGQKRILSYNPGLYITFVYLKSITSSPIFNQNNNQFQTGSWTMINSKPIIARWHFQSLTPTSACSTTRCSSIISYSGISSCLVRLTELDLTDHLERQMRGISLRCVFFFSLNHNIPSGYFQFSCFIRLLALVILKLISPLCRVILLWKIKCRKEKRW